MKDKLVFTKSYVSRRSNGANRAYWKKYIKSLFPIDKDDLNIYNIKFDSFNNIMPIFCFISFKEKRGVVIYQYETSLVSIDEVSYSKYMTAWTSQKNIEGKRISILTVYMIPSLQNNRTAKNLIKSWYFNKRMVKSHIEEIYRNQIEIEDTNI